MPGWRTLQTGKRVYTRSEEEAWKHVRDIARRIPGHTGRASGLGGMPAIDTLADELLDLSTDMLEQLKIGIHENPRPSSSATRRNPESKLRTPPRSEKTAWEMVLNWVYQGLRYPVKAKASLLAIDGIAGPMLEQVESGTHVNPPLVVMGFNPPTAGEQLVSKRVYGLEYQHAADKENYRHDFATGVTLYVTRDNKSLILYRPDGKPLAKEFL